jgi:hypothetical protein
MNVIQLSNQVKSSQVKTLNAIEKKKKRLTQKQRIKQVCSFYRSQLSTSIVSVRRRSSALTWWRAQTRDCFFLDLRATAQDLREPFLVDARFHLFLDMINK